MTEQKGWDAVDGYIVDLLVSFDDALDSALDASRGAGLPEINVAPNQGKFLMLLARAMGARRILEIGTLGGYSTIWLARGLDADGLLVTLELESKHAEVASTNLTRAGVSDIVDIRVGPALDSLAALIDEGAAPFDLVFIDADKIGYHDYYEAVLPKLSERGLIVVDNVLWSGRVAQAPSDDDSDSTTALRAFNDHVAADERVVSVMLSVRDGVTLVRRA